MDAEECERIRSVSARKNMCAGCLGQREITAAYDGWPDLFSTWCRAKANRSDVLLRFGAFELDLSTAEFRTAGLRSACLDSPFGSAGQRQDQGAHHRAPDAEQAQIREKALANEKVKAAIAGKEIVKVLVVKQYRSQTIQRENKGVMC